MASLHNGHSNGNDNGNGNGNGVNGHDDYLAPSFSRFAHIPPALDVPLSSGDGEEAVEVNLEDLMDDPTELCTLLENENVARNYWMTIALAYAKQQKMDHAVDIVSKGLSAQGRSAKPEDKLSLLSCLCWLHLWQCREAPRLKPETQLASEARNKEHYIHQATSTLNEASRISPTYPPLFLARGVLYLLRASLQPSKSSSSAQESERIDTLRQAVKCFEDALRSSQGRNMLAVMGKARALFSLGKYADALINYQTALERAPDLQDPDPRIGIGCCFWQLGHKQEAHTAWTRALHVNPSSKIANILLGLFHLDQSAKFPSTDPEFQQHYKKAMTEYTQTAWKLDNKFPLTCATFGNYFILRKAWPTVERLARQAIEATDVNAIASDGWYLLARKEHQQGNVAKATDFYNRSDQARGGDNKGYLPAKFGAAQLKILSNDYDGAKFRLESIIQVTKSVEAMTLLGLLYAEDVYANQAAGSKEDKSNEMKKAIALLDQVRNSWKDLKKKTTPDSHVLLNLARLYEVDSPERSLQCLQQVELMEIDDIDDEDRPQDIEDEAEMSAALREMLPPQLLNNMASFHFQAERFGQARQLFQVALNACVKLGAKDSQVDTDSLVTSISYNLARTYEAENMLTEAKQVYQGLLERHPDYTDARVRLTYIALREDPNGDGAQAIRKLIESEPGNLDVRALYGWHIHKAKKRTMNPAEDQEQRHYKHTLQHHDKHDRYSLTGMGNLFLQVAREMRRDTDQDKEKRSKTYIRAIEFFDKALQLDPRNAYAAQGIGIALIEDKKDYASAIQIFTKVKETMRDASVFINMGHVFVEVKQYARAIENYEQALAKDRTHDPTILACLGRVWLLRGKQEKSIQAMKTALEYSNRALETSPEQVHFKFNVAFVQIQIAQLIYTLPDAARTLVDLEAAAAGLDEAIESFISIARSPNPPFPKHDIEQRANMGKNTMRKQLDRALQSQRDYEHKNATRLEQAKQQREAEIKKRQDERKVLEDAEEERRKKIAEERQRMLEQDREIIEQKIEQEADRKAREAADLTTDEETGDRKKREKKGKGGAKRRKKGGDSDSDIINDEEEYDGETSGKEQRRKSRRRSPSGTPASDDEGAERPKKKKRRKLERKIKAVEPKGKFKSSEVVVDSDSDDAAVTTMNDNTRLAEKIRSASPNDDASKDQSSALADEPMADGSDEGAVVERRKKTRVIDEDDEDEEEEQAAGNGDVSMVDETAPAAGDKNAPDS